MSGSERTSNQGAVRVQLLPDLPSDTDSFGGHERVARAIADLICGGDEGCAIGVEGRWGSGKSTVVQLAESTVRSRVASSTKDVKFFWFDAWAHAGDPLRRSFLEKLIDSATEWQWLSEERAEWWASEKERLSKRSRQTETETSPALTADGRWMLLLLFLVPLGIVLINAGLNHLSSRRGIAAAIGALLVVSPGLFAAARLRSAHKKGEADEANSWIYLLVNKTVTRDRTETIETPDPTSLEFEERFRHLCEDCLLGDDGSHRSLVVVLDNLDRLTSNSVAEVLSTLQAFLRPTDLRLPPWWSRLWVVVPFAAESIYRAGPGQDGEGRALLEKLFRVRFFVPTPVLSDWSGFLEKQLELVLPEESGEARRRVVRCYQAGLRWRGETASPTPRQMKHFANQVGTLARVWQREIPLGVLALFVVLDADDRQVDEVLRDHGGLPTEELKSIVGPEGADYLAAVFYGTDVRTARQLLMGAPMLNALLGADPDTLDRLVGTSGGYLDVLLGFPFIEWAADGASNLAHAACAIARTSTLDDVALSRVNERLAEAVDHASRWNLADPSEAAGLAYLLGHLSDVAQTKIVERLSDSDEDGPRDEASTISRMERIDEVISGLESSGNGNAAIDAVRVNCSPTEFVAGCAALAGSGKSAVAPYIRSSASAAELGAHIAPLLRIEPVGQPVPAALQTLLLCPAQVDWSQPVEAAAGQLEGSFGLSAEDIGTLLRVVRLGESQGIRRLPQLESEGYLQEQIFRARSLEASALTAQMIVDLLTLNPTNEARPVRSNGSEGTALVERVLANDPSEQATIDALAHEIRERQHEGLPLDVLRARDSARPWAAHTLGLLIGEGIAVLDAATVVEEADLLYSLLGADQFKQLVLLTPNPIDVIDCLKPNGYSNGRAVIATAVLPVPSGAEAAEWAATQLAGLTKADWASHLASEGEAIQLLMLMVDSQLPVRLGKAFEDALHDHALAMARGEVTVSEYARKWPALVRALDDPPRRDGFWLGVAQAVVPLKGRIDGQFFRVVGSALIGDPRVLKYDQLLPSLLADVVATGTTDGLEWVTASLISNPSIFTGATSEAQRAFRMRLDDATQEASDETRSAIERLRNSLP